jgi:plasmid stabilization system protein ParE
MPPVEFDPRAIAEAQAARRFYARASAALAARFMLVLDTAVARVEQFPQGCPPHRHGTRVCPLRRFPFTLVFVEQPTRSLVVAVLAAADTIEGSNPLEEPPCRRRFRA